MTKRNRKSIDVRVYIKKSVAVRLCQVVNLNYFINWYIHPHIYLKIYKITHNNQVFIKLLSESRKCNDPKKETGSPCHKD